MHATISDMLQCASEFKTRIESNAPIRRTDEIDFVRTSL